MVRKLLAKLGFEQKDPTTIYSSSQSAIAFSGNPKHHPQNTHVNIQYHFTWEKKSWKRIQVKYNLILTMIIDISTKALPKTNIFLHKGIRYVHITKVHFKILDALIFEVDIIPIIQASIHALVTCINLEVFNNSCKY